MVPCIERVNIVKFLFQCIYIYVIIQSHDLNVFLSVVYENLCKLLTISDTSLIAQILALRAGHATF